MPIDINDLARRGAASRIAELEQEIAEIRAAFPDTPQGKKRGRPGRKTSEPEGAAGSGEPARQAKGGRKKRVMSAEARARISAAQKKRWAKQKRANG